MSPAGARLLGIGIVVFLTLSPLGIWLALYAAIRWCSFSLQWFVPWMRMTRWIAYVCGLGMYLAHFTSAHFAHDFIYGGAVLTFSFGLSMPETWLKKRLLGTPSPTIN